MNSFLLAALITQIAFPFFLFRIGVCGSSCTTDHGREQNPATSIGAPVCLTWDYTELKAVSLTSFETKKPKSRSKRKNRSPSEFFLSYYKRESILKKAGFSKQEYDHQERKIQWERFRRKPSRYESFPFLFIKSFFDGDARRKSRRFVKRYRKNQQH